MGYNMHYYSVRITFMTPNAAAKVDEWVSWMTDKHLQDVCRAGAVSAHLVRIDDSPVPAFEAHYQFQDRSAFDQYVAGPAVGLRAEGLQRFPTESGIAYSRTSGAVIKQLHK